MVRTIRILTRLSAVSLASVVAFMYPALWFFAPIAVAIFFVDVVFYSQKMWSAALKGLAFGTVFTAASLSWVWSTLPMDAWLAIPQEQQVIFLAIAWSVGSVMLSLPVALGAAILWRLRQSSLVFVVFPFLWILIEEMRLWVFAIYTYGESSLFGPHFSIASFGYTLTESPLLLQLASVGGIFNLNFILAVLAALVVFMWIVVTKRTHERRTQQFATLSLLFILFTSIMTSAPLYAQQGGSSHEEMSFLLLSSKERFGPDKDLERAAMYRDIIQNLEEIPDVIVFPEGQHIETVFPESEDPHAEFDELIQNKETLIIGNLQRETEDGKKFSTTLYEHTSRGVIQSQDKLFLAPFGEYMPDFAPVLFSQAPQDVLYSPGPYYVSGGKELATASHDDATLGTLVCLEAFSPTLYKELVDDHGADVLINISNPSWSASEYYFDRVVQIAKVHAVQNRTYFLTASVEAPAFVVDPNGTLLGQTEYNTTSGMIVHVPKP